MNALEHVKLLEDRVDKALAYVKRLIDENNRLADENNQLREAMETSATQCERLETLVKDFRSEQELLTAGIMTVLDRLSQFEDAVEKTLNPESAAQENGENGASDESAQNGTADA